MNKKAKQEAENFLNNEKEFHLGVLPTEQSNPKTRNLDKKFATDPAEGVKMLLSVDRDVQKMAQKRLKSDEFYKMIDAGSEAVLKGKKIVFSGCGSTGRLSILLESMWRRFFRDLSRHHPELYGKVKKYENCVYSIMTGGDYALIRSVESFEDFQKFGKQQARELSITEGDVLIAITEGGETSSVLGTLEESADRGAKIFLLFNNPSDILVKHIERSKKAIEDPRVTVLDLFCGPMAIAGSTRMEAITAELLIAGAALEAILKRTLEYELNADQLSVLGLKELNYAEAFEVLLDELLDSLNIKILADYIKLEVEIYKQKGLVTYFANDYLLDIFTDTTERAPTFMLPPFKKYDDTVSPPSWAFVKNPLHPTPDAWINMLGRQPRCLEWNSSLYRSMGAPEHLITDPPQLDKTQLMKFLIGNERDRYRISRTSNVAVNLTGSSEINSDIYNEYKTTLERSTSDFQKRYSLIIGKDDEVADFRISCFPAESIFKLMERLAVKLVLNTISTGTMVLMGRVTSNWMSWVEVSNKKLRDRGIRLISEICGLSYENACYELHEGMEEQKTKAVSGEERLSPVQYTIRKIRYKKQR
jgi:N-acetylmuramic acid 6-phosphate etherase